VVCPEEALIRICAGRERAQRGGGRTAGGASFSSLNASIVSVLAGILTVAGGQSSLVVEEGGLL